MNECKMVRRKYNSVPSNTAGKYRRCKIGRSCWQLWIWFNKTRNPTVTPLTLVMESCSLANFLGFPFSFFSHETRFLHCLARFRRLYCDRANFQSGINISFDISLTRQNVFSLTLLCVRVYVNVITEREKKKYAECSNLLFPALSGSAHYWKDWIKVYGWTTHNLK